MDFQRIQIDGFGILTDQCILDLGPGLNVYHGPNGSGKTTLLHFLRAMFCGFEEARRLQLLPPIHGGIPGGSLTLNDHGNRFTVVRRSRPGQTEALAIQVRQGTTDGAELLRHRIEKLDRVLVHHLYFVGSHEAHSLNELARLAMRDGIDLSSHRTDAMWISPLVHDVVVCRRELWDGAATTGLISQSEQELAHAQQRISLTSYQQQLRQEAVVVELDRLRMHRQRLDGEYRWLLSEIPSVDADLTECQSRLWSRRSRLEREVQQVAQSPEAVEPRWVAELLEVDHQIEHAKQVLRDLAAVRLRLTLASVEHVCAETPDEAITLQQQRNLLQQCEQRALAAEIDCRTRRDSERSGTCDCEMRFTRFEQHLTDLRQTIYTLCQLISRREAVITRQAGLEEQARIDRCEQELLERIRCLRERREELLQNSSPPWASRVRHAVSHERQTCRCEGHAEWAGSLPGESVSVSRPFVERVTEREVIESDARPGDAALEPTLATRRVELQQRLFELQGRIRDAVLRIADLESELTRFADDHSVGDLQFAATQTADRLASLQDDWMALAFQERLLSDAQHRLHREVHSPVITEASEYLQRLTHGRYLHFSLEPLTSELLIQNADGQRLPPSALSRGTLDQAALSFRLALVSEYARRGVRLPLVLDDVLVDSDEGRLTAAVDLLREVANQGQQVVFLTCQEHLSDLFDEHGFSVRMLTGGQRRAARPLASRPVSPARNTAGVVAEIEIPVATSEQIQLHRQMTEAFIPPFPHIVENSDPDSTPVRVRLQPEGPYWLRIDSSVGLLPSLGTQMERRLGTLGVGNLGDLILLNSDQMAGELQALQISLSQLRGWQAEARLLCCVPDLTGTEAQLLSAVGIQNPVELGAETPETLWQRIERARLRETDTWQSWMADRTDWPDVERVRVWTRNGRRAMSLRAAIQWAGWRPRRLQDLEQGDWAPWTPGRSERETRTPRAFVSRGEDSSKPIGEHTTDDDGSPRRRPTLDDRSATSEPDVSEAGSAPRYYLDSNSPIVDAPSIGPKMAEKLNGQGILTVHDLLSRNADRIAARLDDPRVDSEVIRTWQAQASLVCRVPGLRGHDAMLLVACDLRTPDQIRTCTAEGLLSRVGPVAATREGQRMLRSATPPDLKEVSDWICWASLSREIRAA